MDVQEEKRRDPSPGDESFGTGSGARRDRASSCTESAGSQPRIQLPASCAGARRAAADFCAVLQPAMPASPSGS